MVDREKQRLLHVAGVGGWVVKLVRVGGGLGQAGSELGFGLSLLFVWAPLLGLEFGSKFFQTKPKT